MWREELRSAKRRSSMLWRLYKAEKMKLRRSPVWLIFIAVPIVPAFLGTMNYLMNTEILQSEWNSLWTQHTLFTSYFFLPILLGFYCSYLIRVEKNNHNLTKLMTLPISRKQLFLAKLLSAGKIILLSQAWIGALVIEAMQLIISLFCDSFALSVGISFAGGFTGLFAMAKGGYGHLYPYSLMAYGMVANNSKQQLTAEGYPQFVFICILYLILFTAAGAMIMERKEV